MRLQEHDGIASAGQDAAPVPPELHRRGERREDESETPRTTVCGGRTTPARLPPPDTSHEVHDTDDSGYERADGGGNGELDQSAGSVRWRGSGSWLRSLCARHNSYEPIPLDATPGRGGPATCNPVTFQ